MGRSLSFDVDLSSTGCGCNMAVYTAQLRQNPSPGTCPEPYCDANAVCGARCDEIDLMEASTHAFHSVAHHATDGNGQGGGIGGSHGVDGR